MIMRYSFAILTLLASCLACSRQAPPQMPPRPVVIAKTTTQSVPIYLDAAGYVQAYNEVNIIPQRTGKLIMINFDIGEYVKKGHKLYELDSSVEKAALDKAKAVLEKDQAALRLAKEKMERYADLAKKDYISQLNYQEYKSAYETAQAQVDEDKADVETAQVNFDRCTIYAPLTGRLGRYLVDLGNIVIENQTVLIKLMQLTPILISFNVPQSDFIQLQQLGSGEEWTLEFYVGDSIKDKNARKFEGKVISIDNEIDLQSGTVRIQGQIANEDEVLWPGEYGIARILLETKKNAILIPEDAVQIGQKGEYVFVYEENNTVSLRTVKTGGKQGNLLVIDEGLKAGESVVTEGQINLRPGSPVFVLPGVEQEKKS